MTTDVGICSLELCKKRPKINLFAIAQVQNDHVHGTIPNWTRCRRQLNFQNILHVERLTIQDIWWYDQATKTNQISFAPRLLNTVQTAAKWGGLSARPVYWAFGVSSLALCGDVSANDKSPKPLPHCFSVFLCFGVLKQWGWHYDNDVMTLML